MPDGDPAVGICCLPCFPETVSRPGRGVEASFSLPFAPLKRRGFSLGLSTEGDNVWGTFNLAAKAAPTVETQPLHTSDKLEKAITHPHHRGQAPPSKAEEIDCRHEAVSPAIRHATWSEAHVRAYPPDTACEVKIDTRAFQNELWFKSLHQASARFLVKPNGAEKMG
jgi:hypothetical protein